MALTDAALALEPTTSHQSGAYRGLVDTCTEMALNRALIEATTGQSLQPIEWIGLLLLLLILMALIVVLPGGTLWGALIAGALAGTLVTLVVPDPYPNRSTKIVTLEDLSRGSPWSAELYAEASRVGDG